MQDMREYNHHSYYSVDVSYFKQLFSSITNDQGAGDRKDPFNNKGLAMLAIIWRESIKISVWIMLQILGVKKNLATSDDIKEKVNLLEPRDAYNTLDLWTNIMANNLLDYTLLQFTKIL